MISIPDDPIIASAMRTGYAPWVREDVDSCMNCWFCDGDNWCRLNDYYVTPDDEACDNWEADHD